MSSIADNHSAVTRPNLLRRRARTTPGAVLRLGAVATPAEVDRTLKDLVRRLAGASPQTRSTPSGERKLVVFIPDLELVYTGAYSAGAISSLRKAARPNGEEDVKITVSSDDLIALADGRLGVGSALLWGKLRVEAGARDLLLLRQLF
jgi:predicted lipid carrier protein YhbT